VRPFIDTVQRSLRLILALSISTPRTSGLYLCGDLSSPSETECWEMYLVRFEGTTESWATQLTDSSPADPPYRTTDSGASRTVQFVWAHSAYPHRGRIAFDGANYGAYTSTSVKVLRILPCEE
jgi:hypothetical protein